MRASYLYFLAVLLLTLACGAQASNGEGTDSNTHWLSRCSTNADCGEGLTCTCGVCSQECRQQSTCSKLEDGALCITATCPGEPEELSLCSKSCRHNFDCGDGAECLDDECVPRLASELQEDTNVCQGDVCDAGPGEAGVLLDWRPCAEKQCGEPCSPCDPQDPMCDPQGSETFCSSDGQCESQVDCPDGAAANLSAAPSFRAGDCDVLDIASTSAECAMRGWVPSGDSCIEWLHCGCIGNDCERVSESKTDCLQEFQDCLPPAAFCGSLDVQECEACDCDANPTPYYWTGEDCTAIGCCVGSDCEQGYASREACRTQWTGCRDVPVCDDADFPLMDTDPFYRPDYPAFGFTVVGLTVDEESTDPAPYSTWTQAEWVRWEALPVEPQLCPAANQFEQQSCPYPQELQLQTADELVKVQVLHHWDTAPDMPTPSAVEFMVSNEAFMVRDLETQMPILMVGSSPDLNSDITMSWTFAPLQFETGDVVCRSPSHECGTLNVEQSLQITSEADPGLALTLKPLSQGTFSLNTDQGQNIPYSLSYAYGSTEISEFPNTSVCGTLITRKDSFVLQQIASP